MKKYFFILLTLISSAEASDLALPSYEQEPLEYLLSKKEIIYGVKISGPMPYGIYFGYLESFSSLSREELADQWVSRFDNKNDEFLVIKSLKGSELKSGDIITVSVDSFPPSPRLNRQYILFLNETDQGNYVYGNCDYFEIPMLSDSLTNKLLLLDTNEMVRTLLEDSLMEC